MINETLVWVGAYFLIATVAAVWIYGRVHDYEIRNFYFLNNKPPIFAALLAYFLILPAVLAALTVYGFGGWTWPKKGVTYDKEGIYDQ